MAFSMHVDIKATSTAGNVVVSGTYYFNFDLGMGNQTKIWIVICIIRKSKT